MVTWLLFDLDLMLVLLIMLISVHGHALWLVTVAGLTSLYVLVS
jgi:hypothetical protein